MKPAVHAYTTDALDWRPYVAPVKLEDATPAQRDALRITPSNKKVSEYVLVLAHDPETLLYRSPLFNKIMFGADGLGRALRELGAIGASIVNRCVYCVAAHARQYNQLTKTTAAVDDIFANETHAKLPKLEQSVFDFSVKLSASPPAAGSGDLDRLKAAGLNDLETLDLVFSTAIFAWANRLMHTLGEPTRSGPC